MTTYSQGDVVLVPFPYTDLSTTKQRPALVVSANWFNKSRRDCVLVAITSQVPSSPDRDELALSSTDLTSGGLPKPSIVKVGKIVTIEQNLIRKPIGVLPSATLVSILNGVWDILSQ